MLNVLANNGSSIDISLVNQMRSGESGQTARMYKFGWSRHVFTFSIRSPVG